MLQSFIKHNISMAIVSHWKRAKQYTVKDVSALLQMCRRIKQVFHVIMTSGDKKEKG